MSTCAAKKRPLSPHITIYKPQITAISSILPRMAGVFLYFLFALISWGFVYSVYYSGDISSTILWIASYVYLDNFTTLASGMCVFIILYAFFMYFFALCRHLIWDFGYCLDLKIAKTLGYLIFILSFVSTFVMTLCIFW